MGGASQLPEAFIVNPLGWDIRGVVARIPKTVGRHVRSLPGATLKQVAGIPGIGAICRENAHLGPGSSP